MCKKIFAFLLAFSMMFTISVPASASEKLDVPKANSGYQIMWDNTDLVIVTLNFSGNKAACSAEIYARSGTNKISATLLLKQVTSSGTKTVKSWTKSVSSDTLYFDEAYYVTSGNTYILEVNASVYRNGTVEYVTASDRDSC
ncbi:MAG: hypothetical protein E6579_09280 [Clostridium sp.]|uniref:hypothetical protein n=1 Tax=Faecalispora jeddahensis TaxID=1414721 RepID=UPI0029159451|nr:hypothetical protein [Clostridium sp.]